VPTCTVVIIVALAGKKVTRYVSQGCWLYQVQGQYYVAI